jgi:Aspartyl protease
MGRIGCYSLLGIGLGLLLDLAPARAESAAVHELVAKGEILFRQSRFEEAATAWKAAIQLAPGTARAEWGLGRIEHMQFDRKNARSHFVGVFRLDWRDPDIVLDYAAYSLDAKSRKVLYRNFLALTEKGDRQRIDDVTARLEIEERLGARTLSELRSPYRDYHLKLEPFFPTDGRASGLLVRLSINDGRPMRLLLDSGADGILVNRSARRGMDLEILAHSMVGGLGPGEAVESRIALARTVSMGGFSFSNQPVQMLEADLTRGADGVIGTNVFQRFLLRLDTGARILDLIPFEEPGKSYGWAGDPWLSYDGSKNANSDEDRFVPAYRMSHYLFVQAALNSERHGFFMLDSGSGCTLVSRDQATGWRMDARDLRGVLGKLDRTFGAPRVRLAFGEVELVDSNPLAVDMSQLNRQRGIDAMGIIGYSMLNKSVLTINYRDGAIRIEPENPSGFKLTSRK